MTIASSITFFFVLAGLAAMPSSSVALVVARTAASGTRHGFAVALGIVAGDLLLMALAILGMAALAAQLGAFFAVIRYAAALYLIWFGVGLIRSWRGSRDGGARVAQARPTPRGGLATSFGAGLLLTLGDIKAIFFYASLLPTFVDLTALSGATVAWLVLVTILAVGGVKLVYVFSADRVAARVSGFSKLGEVKAAAGAFFVAIGGYLLVKG